MSILSPLEFERIRRNARLGGIDEEMNSKQKENLDLLERQARVRRNKIDRDVNRRFNKAKELLRFTIKPVDEIIDESGIKDAELFKKLFKIDIEIICYVD